MRFLYVGQGGYFNRSNSTNAMGGQKKHPTLAIYRPPSMYIIKLYFVL